MQLLLTIVVCLFAGAGAGLGTGFAGMSAAAVITPMLVTFLHIEPYTAVGIALASDVLASAVSAYTYGRNRNLDIRNGLIMMITVLAFTVVGSLVSSLVPSVAMGNFSVLMTLLLGIKFIVRPVMTTMEDMQQIPTRTRIIKSIVCGAIVGFICGFIGAGGGMMMLLLLTGVMGYELKTAVGTSVFIMTFTALTGSVSHFASGLSLIHISEPTRLRRRSGCRFSCASSLRSALPSWLRTSPTGPAPKRSTAPRALFSSFSAS